MYVVISIVAFCLFGFLLKPEGKTDAFTPPVGTVEKVQPYSISAPQFSISQTSEMNAESVWGQAKRRSPVSANASDYSHAEKLTVLFEALQHSEVNIASLSQQLAENPNFLREVLVGYSYSDLQHNLNAQSNMVNALQNMQITASISHTLIDALLTATDPVLAETAYALISEADLDNPELMATLIARVGAEPTADAQRKTLNLLYDLDVAGDNGYLAEMDDFLVELSTQADEKLRTDAIIKRAWLKAESDQYSAMVMLTNEFLLDHSVHVRRAMYDIIELEILDSFNNPDPNTMHNLNVLLDSTDFDIQEDERGRIEKLLDMLALQ